MTILVVGSINMDLVLTVDHFPSPGETVPAARMDTFPGGKGANQAIAVARLGGAAALVGRVGSDPYGAALLDGLQKNHVDTSHVLPLDGTPSGMAFIAVDRTGQNTIVISAGANARLSPGDVERAFGRLGGEATLLLSQLEVPLETVLRAITLAQERGLRTVFNPAPPRSLADIAAILAKTDVLVLNETEAQALTGIRLESEADGFRAASILLGHGPEEVIVTLGAAGCLLVDRGQSIHVAAVDVAAVDTTAAGDAFIGGLCVSILEGRPMIDAVRFANAAGAVAVTRHGAQPSLPSRAEVDRALSSVPEAWPRKGDL